MAIHSVISANSVRNNSSTVLNGGNVVSTATTKAMTMASNQVHAPTLVLESVQVGTSGNLGTFKPLAAGKFAAPMTPGNYIAKGLTNQTLAGAVSYSFYATTSNTAARQAIMRFKGYQRLGISSINYNTGVVSYSANRGVTTLASGIDGATGVLADHSANPTASLPGELTYMVKGTTATQDDYKAKTSY